RVRAVSVSVLRRPVLRSLLPLVQPVVLLLALPGLLALPLLHAPAMIDAGVVEAGLERVLRRRPTADRPDARGVGRVRSDREDAGTLRCERRAHLDRARPLGEGPGDVVAGPDPTHHDHVEFRTGLEPELLEAGELVGRDDDAEPGLVELPGEHPVREPDALR